METLHLMICASIQEHQAFMFDLIQCSCSGYFVMPPRASLIALLGSPLEIPGFIPRFHTTFTATRNTSNFECHMETK
jgi:hypothetical protein